MMPSAQSPRNMWRHRDQHRASDSPQSRHRSKSQRLSSRRHPVPMAYKSDLRPGALRLGEVVRVFSHSAEEWVDAEVVQFVEEQYVRVEYKVEEDWCSKKLHFHSDDLIIRAAVPANQLMTMGACFDNQGDSHKAMEHYTKAERAYQAAGVTKTPEYAYLLRKMGACFGNQGDYHKEMEHYTKAERAYQAAGATKTPAYAHLLMYMGVCFDDQGDNHKAMEHYTKAERAFQAAGATKMPGYADLLQRMGSLGRV